MNYKLLITFLLAITNTLVVCQLGYAQGSDTPIDQPEARGPKQVGYPDGANVTNIKDLGAMGGWAYKRYRSDPKGA